MSEEFLLEIGTEEIPAGFVPGALRAMEDAAAKAFSDARLDYGSVRGMGNPRRLVLHVTELSGRQPDSVREAVGPPRSAAFDASGNPTKAATGFARSQGVEVSELRIKETDKGEYVCAEVHEKGRPAKEILSELLPRLILSTPFPKSMRWKDGDIRFARPIHWLLAVYGGEVVPFEIDGIKSSNLSRGHRFMSPGAFKVDGFASYMQQAKDSYTIVDQDERRKMVRSQIEQAAAAAGGNVLPDEGLIEEVSFLVEYPVAVLGGFDEKFLELPREVLIDSMRGHQRYFALTGPGGGLLPSFITVSNTRAEDMDVVRAGNERVLRARLSDAKFFFDEDRKKPLPERVELLKKVVFQEKLGTTYDKTLRIEELAGYVAETFFPGRDVPAHAKRAAQLAKADLVTSMVGEFPDLQGVMGREYALIAGEPREVAKAIEEHYRPRFSGDAIPESPAGTAVSVADKIDTISGIFAAGMPPTGSEDPYALRRQALGIVAMIQGGGFRVSLRALINKALSLIRVEGMDETKLASDILDFFRQRVSNLLTTEGYRYDTVDAVLAREFDDIADARARVAALSSFREAEGFGPFITTFKRAANIIPEGFVGALDEGMLKDDAERELHAGYFGIKDEVQAMVESGDYAGALGRIASMRPAVDRFFDAVLVMDKDEAVKNNRLSLLALVAGMFYGLADLRKIVV